ncbi:c-type cytochrome [Tautonia plasticadhaerens]|uniref:Cytochrome c6 n=1 Tax=Tautonia plasticadhaerens TaxID=2527974 RepID=A0A518GWI2_9BACT|nr:cytochrome c [Tautonia plasticadhaerens]QDV32957.1 Cytochrome c6 [Tautonia plasticadhaerens]
MMQPRIALPVFGLALAALALASSPAPGGAGVRDQADDERVFALELGRRSFENNCLMCHSAGMVESLRLTPEQWAAEVDKMIGWGAPVPPEEKDGLVGYLVSSFPTDGEAPPPPMLALDAARLPTLPEPEADALPEGDPDRGASLIAEHCATCHGPDARGGELGQNLIARPVLQRPAEYAEILHDGRRRMPGFRFVLSDQQMADTLAWLGSQSD